jgi:hypothetical protein
MLDFVVAQYAFAIAPYKSGWVGRLFCPSLNDFISDGQKIKPFAHHNYQNTQ